MWFVSWTVPVHSLVTGGAKTRDGVLARWSSPHVKGNSTEQIWNRSHGLITCKNSIQMWEIIPMKRKMFFPWPVSMILAKLSSLGWVSAARTEVEYDRFETQPYCFGEHESLRSRSNFFHLQACMVLGQVASLRCAYFQLGCVCLTMSCKLQDLGPRGYSTETGQWCLRVDAGPTENSMAKKSHLQYLHM